ncbi:hypothetical protein [Pedobacter sp. BMA]|uniref:hypothetical protein n=1 Tax=Pedobacter sp. BMA TaxID=1663685 RepID=UPI0006495D34|nr:hypothetical protein [Pedobacter sp. BMA]KLT64383.1 hypothetical protein AB669_17695 [Pedobacter sp. BMA]
MNKIIVKYWLINLICSILLYITYRIVIHQTPASEQNLFEKFWGVIELILNLGISFIYLILMLISSLTFFLNLNRKIRNNFYFSLLSFPGPALALVIYLSPVLVTDYHAAHTSVLTNLVYFPIAYLVITTVEFLLFRRSLRKSGFENSI